MIEEAGEGILLYVCPRGRTSLLDEFTGPGNPADSGAATSRATDSQLRDFGLGAQVLAHLGVRTIRLLTNHPRRIVGVAGYGLQIVDCLPIRAAAKVVPLRERESEG
jgi:3,4-dihydroxy 2-butanone 4-phosphate synthase/GTP cyclohydrolase II